MEVLIPVYYNEFHAFTPTIFSMSPENSSRLVIDKNSCSVVFGHKNKLFAYFKLFLFATKNNTAIFHCLNAGPFILAILRLACVKDVLYHIHGTIYWKNDLQKFFRKIAWRIGIFKGIKFISNSNYSKKVFASKICPKCEIGVVANPFDIDRFKFTNKMQTENLNISYVGRLVQGKNLFNWLKVATELSKVKANIVFHMYGEGPLRMELEKTVLELKMQDRFVFNEFLQDVEQAYFKSDIMLFLSEYESFGNVVIESILCGTPVLVSDIPAMQEIFGEFPFFILSKNENCVSQILEKIGNYETLLKHTKTASLIFGERYSKSGHIERIRKVYESFT